MREVDEVRSVGQAAFGDVDSMFFAPRDEEPGALRVELWIVPLALVFHEEGECVGTEKLSARDEQK